MRKICVLFREKCKLVASLEAKANNVYMYELNLGKVVLGFIVPLVLSQLIPVATDRKTAPHLCPSLDGQQLLGLSSPVPQMGSPYFIIKKISPASIPLCKILN